jgi:hypothetical protein
MGALTDKAGPDKTVRGIFIPIVLRTAKQLAGYKTMTKKERDDHNDENRLNRNKNVLAFIKHYSCCVYSGVNNFCDIQFHHVNAALKLKVVMDMVHHRHSVAKLVIELKKCVPLRCLFHKIYHASQKSQDSDWPEIEDEMQRNHRIWLAHLDILIDDMVAEGWVTLAAIKKEEEKQILKGKFIRI